ncbi:MAG: hypothetical protein JKY88_11500 [Pseudomonadales bacterium]|nr:hypothetical protein [Pseudomonadales bacterium]
MFKSKLGTTNSLVSTWFVIAISLLMSESVLAAGATPVNLYKTYSGNIDYVATGASFRDQPNGVDSCSFVSPMSTSVVLNIPATANIVQSFLYFAGSGSNTAPLHNVNTQIGLTLNGSPISTTPGFDEANYEITETVGTTIDFFAARRDVTSIVTGPGSYTFAGLDIHTVAEGRPNNQTCLGAWALVVIYEDISITDVRVLNLFDGFQDFQFQDFDLQPRNFVLRASASGKMTHITYEGDETLGASGGFEERFRLAIPAGGTPFDLINALNPIDNQFNGTLTGPDVFDVNDTYGLDIDTYDISSILAGEQDQFTATTNYSAAQDLVLLQSEIIIVDNKNLADIEVTLNDIGTFISGTSNSAQYIISIQNNGNGLANPSSGFATGFIHVYDDLPTGISIDSLLDITAPGWNCTASVLALNQLRCFYDLSTLPGAQLDKGGVLPDIFVTVDVAAPPSPVTNIVRVTLCDNNPDTCTTFDNKHTDAAEFDPVNFYEEFEDIFDVFVKSSINNNVDNEITPIIVGVPSDLSSSAKGAVDLNGGTLLPGDIIEYTITLSETAGVTATGVSIFDPIDTDTTGFAFQSTTCSGTPINNFSLGTFTITGIEVPASTSCTVIFQLTVGLFVSAGTSIDNSATVSSGNGAGAITVAPTLLVAGTATGSKILYLDALNTGSRVLTRNIPSLDTSVSVATSASITMSLVPALAASLDINAGIIPVSVWIEASTAGNYDITAELRYDSGGANTLIGTASLNNIAMLTGVGNAQLFPFQINLGSAITDLDLGENITLTLSNGAGSPGSAIFHSRISSTQSNIVVDAVNVINIDAITFYSDLARTIAITSLEAGQDIYIEALISDPFGAFDISDAKLTLIDPNLANQLTNVSMSEDVGAATAGTKTYVTAYSLPPAISIPPGIWVAQITGEEGDEGTVSHTDVDSFTTTAPVVTVEYTVTPLTSSPGGTLTYIISIINGGGSPTSLNISQAIPVGTQNLNITILPSGDASASTGSLLDIQNIVANPGTTIIQFTVDVLGSAQAGDLIDHTILLDNMGVSVDSVAPSVLILPFVAPLGNKLLYGDNFGGVAVLDRTVPVSDSNRSISSQGGNTTIVLSPVL